MYLYTFNDADLYRSFSTLEDHIFTSQKDESQIGALFWSNIRVVEPKTILTAVVVIQRTAFIKRFRATLFCTKQVPLKIEHLIARQISTSKFYQSCVSFIPSTHLLLATVATLADPTKLGMVKLQRLEEVLLCCSFSRDNTWFPWHLFSDKHVSINVQKYISKLYLASSLTEK